MSTPGLHAAQMFSSLVLTIPFFHPHLDSRLLWLHKSFLDYNTKISLIYSSPFPLALTFCISFGLTNSAALTKYLSQIYLSTQWPDCRVRQINPSFTKRPLILQSFVPDKPPRSQHLLRRKLIFHIANK